MADYSADYLERLLQSLEDFEDAFERWMETQVESDHLTSRGLFPTAWTKDDADPAEVRSLELDVAEAAGRAARAVTVTGAYLMVAGAGAIDPITNWSLMAAPRALVTPGDIRKSAANVRGRLLAMLDEVKASSDSNLPAFAPAQMHPVIWGAAAAPWTSHQYRVAVREAAEALTLDWKARLGREDASDTEFWQQTLSPGPPTPGRPKLVWPGEPTHKTTKSIRGGLQPLASALNGLATGLNLTVRNVTTHTRHELSEQDAMERLAAYSYLARLLDQCMARSAEDHEEDGA
jgi:hypothetical protein